MEKLPQEIEVWYVIPQLRKEFAVGLRQKGLRQKEIASILGLTGAAVSQYISLKRAGKVNLCRAVKEEVSISVGKISENKGGANEEIQRILSLMRSNKYLCESHKEIDKTIHPDCMICFTDKK